MEDRRRLEYATYEYNPTSIPPSRPRITADGPLLHVLNVTVRDSGPYELEATNDEGKTDAKIYINVQYPALIKDTSGNVSVPLGEDAVLECEVGGNPLLESMMKWRRSEFDFTNTEQKFGNQKAILKLFKVRRNDTGIFTCEVDNGIGVGASANVSLIVEAKPVIRKSKLLSIFAAKEGGTGVLKCEADGAPEVHFVWKKNRKDLQKAFGKYYNETEKGITNNLIL
ncbi:Synaptogenesis protein syg-2 [Armadillidium nasatum]|uniref:Synaptogenesis protein syg-2 n=1 Tax=Armadillidium nasatum TaxID=96803 RepID=A0A5N5TN70_9CRUS|nr:Synaptogenesis protein syg-2 [Armadillidium nasatum]